MFLSHAPRVDVSKASSHRRRNAPRFGGKIQGSGIVQRAQAFWSLKNSNMRGAAPRRSIPEGREVARAMKIAMRCAKVNACDVDYISAHATSTPIGDIFETRAIWKTNRVKVARHPLHHSG